ncbi:MAG: PspC domain-containing protein [Acidimicrobiales bacterium]
MDTAPDETPDSFTLGTPSADSSGAAAASGPSQPPSAPAGPQGEQRLRRVGQGRMLAGVAAGLADFFDVDATIVRIAFVALAFLGGLAVPLYLAGWLLIPDEYSDTSVAEELLARERAHGAI